MRKGVKIFAAIGCSIILIPCVLGFFTVMFQMAGEFSELEKKAKLRLQTQANTQDEIRSKLTELQDWFDDNGLGEDQESSKRVNEAETFFVDVGRFEKYFSVLDRDSNFRAGQDVENPFDSTIKTLMDQNLVMDLGNSEFAEHQRRFSSAKYVVLYVLGITNPAKGETGRIEAGGAAYQFTLVELEDLEVIGSFIGFAENSDKVSYLEGNSIVMAAKRDLLKNLKEEVEKRLAEEFWVR